MSETPTFSLPPCPVCSTLRTLERPVWRFAHNTTRARKRNCYMFSGCVHSDEVADPKKLYDVPEEWSLVEDAWAERVEMLFAEKTRCVPWDEDRRAKWLEKNPGERLPIIADGWTDEQRRRFRSALADRTNLPGATEPLNLSPEVPAQQETRTNEET